MKTSVLTGVIAGGWADFNFILKDKKYSIHTSYIGDDVEKLLSAVTLLNAGLNETECIWHDEPYTHIVSFYRNEDTLNDSCYCLKFGLKDHYVKLKINCKCNLFSIVRSNNF